MVARNRLFKWGLGALVLCAVGVGFWSINGPFVAVNKSPVPAKKCCSTWEDHMRASGVDKAVDKAFDVQMLLASDRKNVQADDNRAMVRHALVRH